MAPSLPCLILTGPTRRCSFLLLKGVQREVWNYVLGKDGLKVCLQGCTCVYTCMSAWILPPLPIFLATPIGLLVG